MQAIGLRADGTCTCVCYSGEKPRMRAVDLKIVEIDPVAIFGRSGVNLSL